MQVTAELNTYRPTGKRVLDQFYGMVIVINEEGKREFPLNVRVARRVMHLLEVYVCW